MEETGRSIAIQPKKLRRHVQEIKLFGESQNLISMSLVSKENKDPTKPSSRIPRDQEIMGDSSEIDEVPISDPPATRRRTWSESSASLADQLISPTSVGSGFSLETSGEWDTSFEFEIVEVWHRCKHH